MIINENSKTNIKDSDKFNNRTKKHENKMKR